MLEKIDLGKHIDDQTYAKKIAPLYQRLGVLQRAHWDLRVPIVIVVEGWNASGITTVISR